MNTRNFEDLGSRERAVLATILNAWTLYGLPDGFEQINVVWEFNPGSGCLFLINEDYQTLMLNGDRLEEWVTCSDCGAEGFGSEMDGFVGSQCAKCLDPD